MEKLNELIKRCKNSVTVTVNDHRDVYMSASDWLVEFEQRGLCDKIEPSIRKGMIDLDSIIEIHFYPDTAIGFYVVVHFDLELALDAAMECIEIESKMKRRNNDKP